MIEINNLTAEGIDEKFKNEISLDEKFLEKVAKIVIKGENMKMKDISVVLVGEAAMRMLNKKYRQKDKATDVLSFNYGDSGEVVLCPEIINKFVLAAKPLKTKIAFKKEIARILIHGLLHLSGYEHEKSKKEAKKMEEKESFYIKLCQSQI